MFIVEVGEESFSEEGQPAKRSSEEIKALWKKAILETLLLIRMERENTNLLGKTLLNFKKIKKKWEIRYSLYHK